MATLTVAKSLGWIQKYLIYTNENEAPELYHLWSGITVLAHTLGRQVWMERGYFKTYPGTMMTILVGPSGVRKSTAVNIATALLREIPSVKIISDKLSAQSLIDQMDRGMVMNGNGVVGPADSVVFINASELAVFIPKQNYVEEIIPILTKLADAEDQFEYKTRTRGDVYLKNPLATLLAASTPDWLAQSIPESSYGGGFMSRIFFVFQSKTTRFNPRPERNKKLERLKNELSAELLWIANSLKGPIVFDPDAFDYWDKFYANQQANPNVQAAGFIGGYFGRRSEHTLRVAICIAASARHEMIVRAQDIRWADLMLKQLEAEMPGAFEQFGASSLSIQQQRIVDVLQGLGPIEKTVLYKRFWRVLDKNEFDLALDSLVQAGLIDQPYLIGRKLMVRPMK